MNNNFKAWMSLNWYNMLLRPTKYTAGMEKYLYNKD